MQKITIILFTALLTLSMGMWAENPPEFPVGHVVNEGVHYLCENNEYVKVVKNSHDNTSYSGNIVIPAEFDFTDQQSHVYHFIVKRVDVDAFKDCTNLTSVEFQSITPPILDEGSFEGCTSLQHIDVPYEAILTYQVAES